MKCPNLSPSPKQEAAVARKSTAYNEYLTNLLVLMSSAALFKKFLS
ncbi:MAG: hypothetical protein J6Y08_09280 [Clostridiales bacterium]|nr:hypothetical protein [Clostridiales bacterium]